MVDSHADRASVVPDGAGRRDRVVALLELAAADDSAGFRAALDAVGGEAAAELADEVELWRGRSKAYEPRTPLMVAATCGSTAVVALLLGLGRAVDVNRSPGVDGATALHCAASGGSPNAAAVVTSLLAAGADPATTDCAGRVPADVIQAHHPASRAELEALLGRAARGRASVSPTTMDRSAPGKKEYPADPTLPDMNSSVYASDEFRMFAFKVQPCARAYAHDWTECPFVHPGENARRRDPRWHAYTAVPCASFRRVDGGCPHGDACDFAHGVFESWLHPSQYRTRICRDGAACARRICFFAHAEHELRHVPPDDTGAGVLSPRAMDDMTASAVLGLLRHGSPTGGVAAHRLQQGSRLRNSFNASLDGHVDELGVLLDLASLRQSQQRLSSIPRPPAIVLPSTYMALPPSRFVDDHVDSPEAAQTSQLLAKIRQQQGVLRPPVTQREMLQRSVSSSSIIKRHQMQSMGLQPAPAPGYYSADSWANMGCPSNELDWSFDADKLLRSP